MPGTLVDDRSTDWQDRAAALGSAERRSRRRLLLGLVAGGLILAVMVPLVVAPALADDPAPAMCAADTGIEGFEGPVRHANGITEWNGGWLAVLTGIPYVAEDQRQEIAAAVVADDTSYRHLLTTLDPEVRPAVEHLHDLAVDPERGAASITWDQGTSTIEPGTLLAIQTVAAAVVNRCGYLV
jgi:hypothetical protein